MNIVKQIKKTYSDYKVKQGQKKIFAKMLSNPDYEWRSVKGISSSTGLSVNETVHLGLEFGYRLGVIKFGRKQVEAFKSTH